MSKIAFADGIDITRAASETRRRYAAGCCRERLRYLYAYEGLRERLILRYGGCIGALTLVAAAIKARSRRLLPPLMPIAATRVSRG